MTDFKNSFTSRLSRKSAIKPPLNIPLYLKHVASLAYEMYVFKINIVRITSTVDHACAHTKENLAVVDKLQWPTKPRRPATSLSFNTLSTAACCRMNHVFTEVLA